MPVNGAYTLAEVAAEQPMLNLACARCDRRGRLSTAKLLLRFPPELPMPSVFYALAEGCPKRAASAMGERCSLFEPGGGMDRRRK